MDVGTDFLQPEFLHLLFFQQKNIVIFPYIDLKHLHALETFTVGHNIIDIESTALYNLREIIEGEAVNSYSQNPNLFLIYNLDDEKVKVIMKIEGIRCILNANENVSALANGQAFIFYNKKTKSFLNYEFENGDLEFEKHLITTSKDQESLFDTIQKIKITATRIFKEYVETGVLKSIASMLTEYPKKYWKKILAFVDTYFDINLPDIDLEKLSQPRPLLALPEEDSPFFQEYQDIITRNKILAKEFILCLHDYREQHVNPANLELEQLYFPQNLHAYLRNHHWKEGITRDFLENWVKMKHSNISLDGYLRHEFIDLFSGLGISMSEISNILRLDEDEILPPIRPSTEKNKEIPENNKESVAFQDISTSLNSILDEIETRLFETPLEYKRRASGIKIKDFSRFKRELLTVIEEIKNKVIILPKKDVIKTSPKKNKEVILDHKKELIFIIDGANVAREGKKYEDHDHLDQIKQVRHLLLKRGADKVYILYDPSLRHFVDDKDGLEEMVKLGIAKPTPRDREADDFILQHAFQLDAYIVTNDYYREEKYESRYGREWIDEKRCTSSVLDGHVALDFKIDDIFRSFPS